MTRWLLFVVLGFVVSGGAFAESVRSLQVAKPAPNNERRIALVIGNSAYKSAPLRNPVNDARAIARTLTETGFAVTLVEDGTQGGMRRAIRSFGDELARGGVGLFYYAGHGMQVRGKNFLIPVNADIQREDEVEDQAVDANLMLSKMDTAKNALNIMILDACRNNPFHRSFRSAAQGLAQMDAPSGTLIAFATAPGSVAADGEGENGTYTKHLLEQIRKPGTPVEQLFKQVRNGVMADTKERQVPWESSSLRGDFFFLMLPPGMQAEEQKRERDQAIQKAVGDALKDEQQRAARERSELQQKMEKMIADALAKQRAMLEAERKGQGIAAPAVASAPPPAPVAASPAPAQVASVAPAPPVAPAARVAGGRWQYAGVDVDNRARKYEVLIELEGESDTGVLETFRTRSGASTWVHTRDATLVGAGPGFTAFSPLVRQEPLDSGKAWPGVAIERVENCGRGLLRCSAQARIEGRETVQVQAGRFETVKVVVEVLFQLNFGNAAREITYWYAPSVRRPVRVAMRTHGGAGPAFNLSDPNTEYELVAYELDGGARAGTIDPALAAQGSAQAGTTAPILVASAGATRGAMALAGPAVPRIGDRWEYEHRDLSASRSTRRMVEIAAVGADGIRERVSVDGAVGPTLQHGPGAYVSGADHVQFAPYLLAYVNASDIASLGEPTVSHFADCAGGATCVVRVSAAGTDRISVPAGTFDATRVDVNISIRPLGRHPAFWGTADLSIWYSRETRRPVKVTGRGIGNSTLMPNFEMNLQSFKLQ